MGYTDELTYVALDFCKLIAGMSKAEIPRHSGKRGREIHVYGTNGKTVRQRFDYQDLNEVMTTAKLWCNRITQQQICEWEAKNGAVATDSARTDSRLVLELLYNNFESMEFYCCIWSRHTQIVARAYKNNTAVKAIMRACLNADRVLKGESYDAVHNASRDSGGSEE